MAELTFLTTSEAAELLRLARRTLERWRVEGGGPSFRRHGARVLYAREDLALWSRKNQHQSTSEHAEAA